MLHSIGGWEPNCQGSCTECLDVVLCYDYFQEERVLRGWLEKRGEVQTVASSFSSSTVPACSLPSLPDEQSGRWLQQYRHRTRIPKPVLCPVCQGCSPTCEVYVVSCTGKEYACAICCLLKYCVVDQIAGSVTTSSLTQNDLNPALFGWHRIVWGWLWMLTTTTGPARSTSRLECGYNVPPSCCPLRTEWFLGLTGISTI